MDWFRCYTELPNDPKLERLPPIASWLWVVMMCLANASPKCGYLLIGDGVPYTLQDIAKRARIRYDHARNFYESFTSLRMIEVVDLDGQATMHLTNHSKRQYASDCSTSRVRKHRAGNVSETLQKQNVTVPETPPDTDTDTDTDKDIYTPPSGVAVNPNEDHDKHLYGDHVLLTTEQFGKLAEKHGGEKIAEMIEILDVALGSHYDPAKRTYRKPYNYVSHYDVLKSSGWVDKEYKARHPAPPDQLAQKRKERIR